MAITGKSIALNGVTLNVIDEGTEGDPVVLLLHGFPDSCQVWRNQIPALRASGYRVVAPDLRGFGMSSKPPTQDDYQVTKAGIDVFGILVSLKIGKFHLVGHDWGALVAWGLAAPLSQPTLDQQLAVMPPALGTMFRNLPIQPQIQSLTALSVGHPQVYKDPSVGQREKSWYIYFFQFAQALHDLQENNYALLRGWSGNHPEADQWIAHFEENKPANLLATLNWYRANTNPDHSSIVNDTLPPIMVPTLGLWGSGDPHQTEESMQKSGDFVDKGKWNYQRVEKGGHWMQLDQPDTVNKLLLGWLQQWDKA